MALGTITVVKSHAAVGPVFFDSISFPGDGSYPTGGSDLLTPFKLKFGETREIIGILNADCGTNLPIYDKGNEKLMMRNLASSGAEIANAVDQSATTMKILVISK